MGDDEASADKSQKLNKAIDGVQNDPISIQFEIAAWEAAITSVMCNRFVLLPSQADGRQVVVIGSAGVGRLTTIGAEDEPDLRVLTQVVQAVDMDVGALVSLAAHIIAGNEVDLEEFGKLVGQLRGSATGDG